MVTIELQASRLFLASGMVVHGLALLAVKLSGFGLPASILLAGIVVSSALGHWVQARMTGRKSIRRLQLLHELCLPVFGPATQESARDYALVTNTWSTARIQVLHFRQRSNKSGMARCLSFLAPPLTVVVLPDSCTRSEQKALCRFLRWRFCWQ